MGPKRETGMLKPELIDCIATHADLSRASAGAALTALLDELTDRLSVGESVSLPGIGSFVVRERQARRARNPRTGEWIDVPAQRRVAFRPAKALRDALTPP